MPQLEEFFFKSFDMRILHTYEFYTHTSNSDKSFLYMRGKLSLRASALSNTARLCIERFLFRRAAKRICATRRHNASKGNNLFNFILSAQNCNILIPTWVINRKIFRSFSRLPKKKIPDTRKQNIFLYVLCSHSR